MPAADDATIERFLERASVLRSSRAVATVDDTAMTMRFGSGRPGIEVDVTGPDDEPTLAYPVNFRALGRDEQFKKWQVIRAAYGV